MAYEKTLTLRLDLETAHALEKLKESGFNMTALIRILIKKFAEEREGLNGKRQN